jgi:hypothetical protein
VASGISAVDTAYWNGKLDSFTETDPLFGESVASGISAVDTAYWNGKLDSFTETDPLFGVSVASGISAVDTAYWNNKLDIEIDASVTNELQLLSIDNDTIYLTDGGYIKLPIVVSEVNILTDSLYISYTNGHTVNAGYLGNGSPGSSLASVATLNITDINYHKATVNSSITDNGNELILSRGVCLSKIPSPDLNDTIIYSGNGSGSYATEINLLEPNTTYYLKAFSTNVVGTTYGNELLFTTKALTVPTISTNPISNITDKAAISGGQITDDGGTPILERGLCWSQNQNPTISDSYITEGDGIGSYIAIMTGLTANTSYYVRAYATNTQGTSYGDEELFTTIELQLASVSTTAASNVSYTTATIGGDVSNDNGSSVTNRGVCWATTNQPTTDNSKYVEAGGLGVFSTQITGLLPNTTYYLRAFAVNGAGTSYGNVITITTLTPSTASLSTKSISGISSNIAGSGGTIVTDGGFPITAKGVCWSINPNPTTANSKTIDGTGSLSFNSTLTGLNPLTLYYVRAYATNGLGTSYGNELSFTTTNLVTPGPTVPVVGTSTATISGGSTASGGGYISSDGGSEVTVRGLCWSTTTNPTLANSYSTDGGTGTGFFTSTITGLSGCGTIYYVRAYATNSTGTGYGNQTTVSTGLSPAVTTDDVTSISYYTAVSGGNITDDGGCPVTQKGVCWNYASNPTIANFKTTEGAGSDAFVSNLTGLLANKTYYVRAYATNSVGTTYGPEIVFTTATPSTLYIGQNYAGGIIFYLDELGEHGLVCAATDQGNYTWGCQGTNIITSTAIGTGASNTAAIVALCATSNTAAKICDNLVLEGYSDWFLPSKDELNLMLINLNKNGIGNLVNYYWSSSEYDSNNAWYYYPGCCIDVSSKTYNRMVRAVRSF